MLLVRTKCIFSIFQSTASHQKSPEIGGISTTNGGFLWLSLKIPPTGPRVLAVATPGPAVAVEVTVIAKGFREPREPSAASAATKYSEVAGEEAQLGSNLRSPW